MKHNTLAIFISNVNQISNIEKIKKEYPEMEDVCIVTDTNIIVPDYAMIPLFYIKFFSGQIVFSSIEDYLNNRDNFPSNQVGLAVTASDIYSSNIDVAKLSLNKVIKL